MMLRYSGSIASGSVITLGLLFLMHQMLAGGEQPPVERPPVRLSATAWTPPPDPPRPPPPDRVELPPPAQIPPDSTLTVDPADPKGQACAAASGCMPTILPPAPPGFRPAGGGIGRGIGLWPVDGELMLLARATPPYPQAALTQNLEGTVLVEFTVDERGNARDARILRSTHRLFDRAALAAVAKLRYRPRTLDGVPVTVAGVRLEFVFELDD